MANAARTHVILDGLQDPALGQRLSARWAATGFANAVDVSGQWAWLTKDGRPLDEREPEAAARIARGFGLEIRDRVGATYQPVNELETLRKQMIREWRMRVAQALMFGLPAIALHYAAPVLAGAKHDARGMFYPWLFELLLVGWATLGGAWPILWQGGWSAIYLRGTADLLTSVIILVSFIPSAVGTVALLWGDASLFPARGPAFHATIFAVIIAAAQRWLAHAYADRIAGRATMLIPHFGRLVGLWLVAMAVVAALLGWRWSLALGLVMPPMLSLGAVNRWSPGVSFALPVVAFAGVLVMGPRAMGRSIEGMQIEIAGAFSTMMTMVMVIGWKAMRRSPGVGETNEDVKPQA